MPENRTPDWSLWRSFEAVVSEGSLTGAAKKLGLSQPTLGRHIEALEADLGVSLFERQLRGLRPTNTAQRLLTHISRANAALAEASIVAAGSSNFSTGTVRLTASTVTSHYSLPAILRDIRIAHPQIDVELVPSDSAQNILLRDVDIAIRMFRPTQDELITKKIAESPLSATASQSYLQRMGTPLSPTDLSEHELVGFDKNDLLVKGAQKMGFDLNQKDFWIRTDSQTMIWECTKAGLGIGFAQDCLIARTPNMERLLPQLHIPPLPVWLTTHKQLHTNNHIRVIFDELSERLSDYYRA